MAQPVPFMPRHGAQERGFLLKFVEAACNVGKRVLHLSTVLDRGIRRSLMVAGLVHAISALWRLRRLPTRATSLRMRGGRPPHPVSSLYRRGTTCSILLPVSVFSGCHTVCRRPHILESISAGGPDLS
jgi:hypothetical protein